MIVQLSGNEKNILQYVIIVFDKKNNKGSMSMNIISQNYHFEFKNLLKKEISIYIDSISDSIIDSLFDSSNNNQISFLANLEENIKNILVKIVVKLIEYYDTFRNYKDRKSHFYFIDELLDFDKYVKYDSLLRATAIDYAMKTNQKASGEITRDKFNSIKENLYSFSDNSIPRSTINRWIKEWYIPNIEYNPISIDSSMLYIMVDEKWIHEQIYNREEIDKD